MGFTFYKPEQLPIGSHVQIAVHRMSDAGRLKLVRDENEWVVIGHDFQNDPESADLRLGSVMIQDITGRMTRSIIASIQYVFRIRT